MHLHVYKVTVCFPGWIYIVVGVLLAVPVIIALSILLIVRTRRQKRQQQQRPNDIPIVAIPVTSTVYNPGTVQQQGNGLPGAQGGAVQITNASQNG